MADSLATRVYIVVHMKVRQNLERKLKLLEPNKELILLYFLRSYETKVITRDLVIIGTFICSFDVRRIFLSNSFLIESIVSYE